MNDQVISIPASGGFINLNTNEPLDSEINIPSGFVETFTDTDLFKYFLTEDLSTLPETNPEFMIPHSPSSSTSLEGSSDSPQPSPPQLSPETADVTLFSQVGTQPFNVNSSVLSNSPEGVPIKQEMLRSAQPSVTVNVTDLAQKAKNSKKRDRATKEESESQALSREELLKISSKGLEVFAQTLANGRQLSPEEEKQLKRQKRLIKNRESAQLSRLRKKIYIEELERKVTHLTSETDSLTKQVHQLNQDKRKLQEEVMYLQSIIKQSPELSEIASKRALPAKNVKAAGICLLIVLFSVGLLFNTNQNQNSLLLRNREEIPEVVPKVAGKSVYAGRVLKSLPEEDITDIEVLPKAEIRESISKTSSVKSVKEELNPLPVLSVTPKEKKHAREDDDKQSDSKRKKMKISEEQEEASKGLVLANEIRGSSVKPVNTEVVTRDPNTSYIYCPEAHHILPATAGSGSEVVALLIPASVLNGSTVLGNHPGTESALLEVSCSVLNLHMWPMQNATTASQP